MASKVFMKPVAKKNKVSNHIHEPKVAAIKEIESRRPQSPDDRRRSRAMSGLAGNSSQQNKFNLGVGVRKMSVLLDRPLSFLCDPSRFRNAVVRVIHLLRTVQLLRSRNGQLVKVSLLKIMNLLQAPQNAGIMNDVGAIQALLDLLNLDLTSHWQIVGMALHGIKLLSLSPECSLTLTTQANFCSSMEELLRSDTVLTQKLAGEIVHHCFVQPIPQETRVVNDDEMISLLFKALNLPYADIQLKLLRLVEDLTYHCANTSRLCSYSDGNGSSIVQLVVELTTEGFNTEGDARHLALMIYRNMMYAAETETEVLKALLPHALIMQHALIKQLHSLTAFQTRKSFIFGEPKGGLTVPRAPMTSDAPTAPKRRSSTMRRNSAKYMQSFVSEEVKHETATEEFTGGPYSSQESLIRRVEQSDAMVEILWLMHSSPVFQKVLKKSGALPKDRMSSFAADIMK